MSFMHNLIEQSENNELQMISRDFLGGITGEDLTSRLGQIDESVDVLKTLMTSHLDRSAQGFGLHTAEGRDMFANRERGYTPLVSMKEALMSNDASIIFKRVISDVLLKPTESIYIGQDILARKVTVDGVKSVTFPTLGALRAGVVTETGEYPEQSPSFNQEALELRVKKYGLKLAMGNDVIEDSMWDIFGLYLSMARDAMKRLKEELIFNEAISKAKVVFDNASAQSTGWTTGQGVGTTTTAGALNGSLTMLDILDMAGALINNGYTPTDFIVHPLMWVMLAKDPRLQFSSLMNGNYNTSMPTPGIDAGSIKGYLPWGMLNVVVSPQMPFKFHTAGTFAGSSQLSANMTDALIVDRQKSLIVLQRDEMSMQEFDHPERDIHMMRVGERYAVGTLDGERSVATARNIRLVSAHNPLYNLGFTAPQ